jgi:hypothetical protein
MVSFSEKRREKMKMKLPDSKEDRAKILELFIERLELINRTSGTIMGTIQILELINEIAIKEGMIECPYCKRKEKGP